MAGAAFVSVTVPRGQPSGSYQSLDRYRTSGRPGGFPANYNSPPRGSTEARIRTQYGLGISRRSLSRSAGLLGAVSGAAAAGLLAREAYGYLRRQADTNRAADWEIPGLVGPLGNPVPMMRRGKILFDPRTGLYTWLGTQDTRTDPSLLPAAKTATGNVFSRAANFTNYQGVYVSPLGQGQLATMPLTEILHLPMMPNSYWSNPGNFAPGIGGFGLRGSDLQTELARGAATWVEPNIRSEPKPLPVPDVVVDFWTDKPPTVALAPAASAPPPRWTKGKDRKGKMPPAVAFILTQVNRVTELLDFIQALFVGAGGSSKWGWNMTQKLEWLFLDGNVKDLDPVKFLDEYFRQQSSDALFGGYGSKMSKSYVDAMHDYGLDSVRGPAWGPLL